jgi:CheY-like chemotaxis protein
MNIVREASGSLLQIIHNILDLSKIETGQTTVIEENFVLEDVINSVSSLFSALAASKQIEFTTRIDPTLPALVRGDPGLLKQIVTNLIGNAIKFTSEGRVSLSIERQEGVVTPGIVALIFHITDTGIGIKPENLERIFEMFEQEDSSFTKRFGGSGLGLSISKRLALLLGGRIWVESRPGIGSRFSFAASLKAVERRGVSVEATEMAGLAEKGPGNRVLIVEDDAFSRRLLVDILEDQDYQVVAAGDGEQALVLLGQQTFDLILMDIQLPLVSGLDVVRAIRSGRAHGCDPAIPVVAITAYTLRGDRERFLSQGMTDYLSKPYNVSQLLATVGRYCVRSGAGGGPGRAPV